MIGLDTVRTDCEHNVWNQELRRGSSATCWNSITHTLFCKYVNASRFYSTVCLNHLKTTTTTTTRLSYLRKLDFTVNYTLILVDYLHRLQNIIKKFSPHETLFFHFSFMKWLVLNICCVSRANFNMRLKNLMSLKIFCQIHIHVRPIGTRQFHVF